MLSVFSLTNAINESVAGFGSVADVEAYEFVGDLSESTFLEMNHEIMCEAVAINEFVGGAEEAMVEAAFNGATEEKQYAMVENVFEQLLAGIKKFIDKIIAMVKGLINKLKAFFYKFTGKTDKWCSAMEKPIEVAQNRHGASDFKYTMHKWDRDYILNKMSNGAKAVFDYTMENSDTVKDVKAYTSTWAGDLKTFAGKNPQDEDVQKKIKSFDGVAKNLDNQHEGNEKASIKNLAKCLDVSGVETLDAVWRDVEKKAVGTEKIEQAIYSDVENMFKTVKESKDTINKLKESYEKHLTKLADFRKKLEDIDRELKRVDKVPTNLVSACKDVINKNFKYVTDEIKFAETAVNNIRSKNLKYLQTMVSEYMGALSKFSGIKDKKD